MQSVSMRPSVQAVTGASAQAPRLPVRRPVAAPRAFVATAAATRDTAPSAAPAAGAVSPSSWWLLRAAAAMASAQQQPPSTTTSSFSAGLPLAAALLAASAVAPSAASAAADVAAATSGNPFDGVQANSLYVTLALFLMSVPGIWSQVKRAPKSKIKRITFQVPGPKYEGGDLGDAPRELDDTARMVFRHFKRYNYEVASAGEVITFAGVYAADRGQAAAVTLYTFFGLGSVALVLATLFPQVGGGWYLLTALSPLAAVYYFRNGERREEVRVKMVAADDDATADVVVEGDADEIERMAKELGFVEKGKVRVKGILEQTA